MPDGLKKHESILLVCVDVDKTILQIDVNQMAAALSEDELVRANNFRDSLLRDRFIAGRFCLREILGKELGMPSSEISFSIENNGKPVVSNSPTHVGHFSFSRSQHYALIGYSASHRIGVDIERVRSLPDMELMAGAIFSEHQLLEWQSLVLAERPLGFFRGWTRKEAVVKVDGRGISDGVRQIEVPLGDITNQVIEVALPACSNYTQNEAINGLLTQWQPNNELVASVALEWGSEKYPLTFSDQEDQELGVQNGFAMRRRFYFAD